MSTTTQQQQQDVPLVSSSQEEQEEEMEGEPAGGPECGDTAGRLSLSLSFCIILYNPLLFFSTLR